MEKKQKISEINKYMQTVIIKSPIELMNQLRSFEMRFTLNKLNYKIPADVYWNIVDDSTIKKGEFVLTDAILVKNIRNAYQSIYDQVFFEDLSLSNVLKGINFELTKGLDLGDNPGDYRKQRNRISTAYPAGICEARDIPNAMNSLFQVIEANEKQEDIFKLISYFYIEALGIMPFEYFSELTIQIFCNYIFIRNNYLPLSFNAKDIISEYSVMNYQTSNNVRLIVDEFEDDYIKTWYAKATPQKHQVTKYKSVTDDYNLTCEFE